jgi:DNA topoisomerase-2
MGANNINLLEPSGQFGTRLQGGKDHASARYIFTRLCPITKKLFDEKDDAVLKYVMDDGQLVEPEYYAPVLPMVLVNGAEGIGTGFSSYVPPYDPAIIKQNIILALDQKPLLAMKPFFKGFNGSVTKKNDTTWVLEGVWKHEAGIIHVTELPPGKWIQDFKEHLDTLAEKGTIVKYENHSTESAPDFRIWATLADPVKELGLTKTIHTSNMYLIGANGAVQKYESPEEILVQYIQIRHSLFKARKARIVAELEAEAQWLGEKARFISLVTSGAMQVFLRPRADIENDMARAKFAKAYWSKMLDIKTYQYTREETDSLLAKVRATNDECVATKAMRVADMWKLNLSVL